MSLLTIELYIKKFNQKAQQEYERRRCIQREKDEIIEGPGGHYFALETGRL